MSRSPRVGNACQGRTGLPPMMERSFQRRMESLRQMTAFVREFFAREGIDDEYLFLVDFCIEEIFTNMIKYNRSATGDVAVGLLLRSGRLTMQLIDSDVDEFDVTREPSPPLDVPLEERQVGGLGLLLVRRMVDDVQYNYQNRRSTITLSKDVT